MPDQPNADGNIATDTVWYLRFICCGRDDGVQEYRTWREADEARWYYLDAPGHDRAAILSSVEGAPDA